MKTFLLKDNDRKRKIFHILVGHSCNNNCLFCMEDDRNGRYRYVRSISKDIEKMINTNCDADEILFTSGEPTLNERLPAYLSTARKVGIPTVGVISNGRRFAYRAYAEKLLRCGANIVTVSIQGHHAKLHDSLTRHKGSFEQTLQGLHNLCALKKSYPFCLQTSTTLNKRNYRHFSDICQLLLDLPVDKLIFNMLMPVGRGARHFYMLMPKYQSVVSECAHFLKACGTKVLQRMFLVDFPYCVTEDLPVEVRGYIEEYLQFEPTACSHSHRAEPAYKVLSRETKEKPMRIKIKSCSHCPYYHACPGIWKSYLEHYGEEEFMPCTKREIV